MPPEAGLYIGRDTMVSAWCQGGLGTPDFGDFRLIETRANRQPALANYVRRPGEGVFRALAIDVLRIEGGSISEIIAFGSSMFPAFGLPAEL